jgi:hypothetical protein
MGSSSYSRAAAPCTMSLPVVFLSCPGGPVLQAPALMQGTEQSHKCLWQATAAAVLNSVVLRQRCVCVVQGRWSREASAKHRNRKPSNRGCSTASCWDSHQSLLSHETPEKALWLHACGHLCAHRLSEFQSVTVSCRSFAEDHWGVQDHTEHTGNQPEMLKE